jgi:hypothetical protein
MAKELEKIDIIKLMELPNAHGKWNKMLWECEQTGDLTRLESVYRGLQIGMKDLAKQGLNIDKINNLFIRLNMSVEKSIRNIIISRQPNPCDNPANKKKWASFSKDKKIRDQEIERYLKRIRF